MEEKIILIIDEDVFSRICSAILEFEGYKVETFTNGDSFVEKINNKGFGLVITSYPYGSFFFEELKIRNIPTIILCDYINTKLINILEGFNNSYCMIKPLNYQKLKRLVRQHMNGELTAQKGYKIV